MSRQSTIHPEGLWYKGNTHAHTSLSDAKLSPQELVGCYRKLGYDFTALTDHRVYGIHENLCSKRFLVLPGVELDVQVSGPEAFCHHVVGLGIPGKNRFSHGEHIEYPLDAPVQNIISLLRENGNLCLYAHPGWSHVWHEILDGIEGLVGIEVYNHCCEVGNSAGHSESWYDRLLWQGRRLWCVACDDDTHQSGSFYASMGPLIEDFYIEDGYAWLKCSPCHSIGFLADTIFGSAVNGDSGLLTEGRYKLNGNESYVRAVCKDTKGMPAWSQPIFIA